MSDLIRQEQQHIQVIFGKNNEIISQTERADGLEKELTQVRADRDIFGAEVERLKKEVEKLNNEIAGLREDLQVANDALEPQDGEVVEDTVLEWAK